MPSRPVHVVVPLDDRLDAAMERFRAPPATWLPVSDASTPRSDGLAVDLVTGGLLPGPLVTVLADVGPILETAEGVAIRRLSWYALRLASTLPTLEADLELDLRSDGGRRPCLRLVGNYITPLAVVGGLADRLEPRRLVTEVARGLLTTVARHLQAADRVQAGTTTNGRGVAAGGVPSASGHTDPGAGSVVRTAGTSKGEDGTTTGAGGATAARAGAPTGTTRPAQWRVAMTEQGSQVHPASATADDHESTTPEADGDQERDRLGMVVLTEDECWDRLEEEPVGRLALVVKDRPYLVPINHVVRGRELYMVSVAGTKLSELLLRPGQPAAFEVDGYDSEQRTGWSVVVHGHLHPIQDLVEHTYQDTRGRPLWLDGFPDRAWMRVDPDQIQGRVLDHGSTRR